MTPRPPSEVSAEALANLRDERDHLAATCDRLTRERDEARAGLAQQRAYSAAELSEAHLALIPLQVDKAAAEKMAIETGRELAEVRAALADLDGRYKELIARAVNAEVDRDGLRADVGRKEDLRLRANADRDKAESSLREHAEAIVALRALASEVKETRDAYRRAGSGLHRNRMAAHVEAVDRLCEALSLTTALASRLSAEREAERAVVEAAQEFMSSGVGKSWRRCAAMTPEQAWDAVLQKHRVFVSRGQPLGDVVLAARDGAIREAERLAYERAAQLLEKRAALFMVSPSEIYNAHLMSVELIVSAKRVRALSQPEAPT